MQISPWNSAVIGALVFPLLWGAVLHAEENIVTKAYQLRMEGKVDEAKQILEDELGTRPKNAAAWTELARLEFQRGGSSGTLDAAQEAIEKAVACSPDNPVYHRWAARIAMYNGILKHSDRTAMIEQFKKVATSAERAVKLDPDDHESRRILISLYGNNPANLGGNKDQAEAHVKALESRSVVDGAAARCEFSLRDKPKQKLAVWEKLAKTRDKDPRVHEELAKQYAWQGDVEQSTLHADKVVALDTSRSQVFLELARAFALQKNYEPAEQFAKKYLVFEPPGPIAHRAWMHMALGRIQQMQGDKKAAAESRKHAQKLDPYCWATMSPPPAQLFAAIDNPKRVDDAVRAENRSVELQQLIDQAKPGSVVKVPPGTYDRPIKIDRPLTLQGESRDECILEVTANEPAISISSPQRVTLASLTIKWQLASSQRSDNPACAVAVQDGRATLRDCRLLPLGNFKRCPAAVQCLGFSNVDLNDCWFEGFEFTIGYSGGSEGRILDCVVINPGHCGISVYSGSTIEVARNIVSGSEYHGVRCTGGTLKAHDNLIIANKNRGFYLGNKNAHGVVNNNVIHSNATGISAFGGSDVRIKNNLITRSSYAGLDTRDSCAIQIQRNLLVDNAKGFVVFTSSGRNQFKLGQNAFWNNGVNAENVELPGNSLLSDPLLRSPQQGDFSCDADSINANKQGLSDPTVFGPLWKKWMSIQASKGNDASSK